MAEFNPSNLPGTCLYCGRKLYYQHRKETSRSTTVTLCCQAPIQQDVKRTGTIAGWQMIKTCQTCHREIVGDEEDTEVITTTTPAWRAELPGPYQDGFFCTRPCGYNFALIAAQKGVRYVRRPPTSEEA